MRHVRPMRRAGRVRRNWLKRAASGNRAYRRAGTPVPTKLNYGNALSHCIVTVAARLRPTNQRLLFRVIPLNCGHDFGACVGRFSPAEHLYELARLQIFVVLKKVGDAIDFDRRQIARALHVAINAG